MELWRCARCGLVWAKDTEIIPDHCPACWQHTGLNVPKMLVCEIDLKDAVIREYGLRYGLLDKRVRRGLEHLKLGVRCPHGYIGYMLCHECQNKSANIIDNDSTVG